MASKKAIRWLRSQGIILERPHTGVEIGNFSAGNGRGRYAMPLHIICIRAQYGTSKETVGYARDLADARKQLSAILSGHGMGNERAEYTYYIRDIRNGAIYRA